VQLEVLWVVLQVGLSVEQLGVPWVVLREEQLGVPWVVLREEQLGVPLEAPQVGLSVEQLEAPMAALMVEQLEAPMAALMVEQLEAPMAALMGNNLLPQKYGLSHIHRSLFGHKGRPLTCKEFEEVTGLDADGPRRQEGNAGWEDGDHLGLLKFVAHLLQAALELGNLLGNLLQGIGQVIDRLVQKLGDTD